MVRVRLVLANGVSGTDPNVTSLLQIGAIDED